MDLGWLNQVTESRKFRRMNGWLVMAWTAMFPIAIYFHWMSSVAFVAFLSLYANWATHLGVWAASRAEVGALDRSAEDARELRQSRVEDAREERQGHEDDEREERQGHEDSEREDRQRKDRDA